MLSHDVKMNTVPWRPISAARRPSLKLDSDSGCAHSVFPCPFLPACIMQQIRHCTMTLRSKDLSLHARFHTQCQIRGCADCCGCCCWSRFDSTFRNSKLFSNGLRGPVSLSSSEFAPSGNQITPRGANAFIINCSAFESCRQASPGLVCRTNACRYRDSSQEGYRI
jgi:hypothetical protein